MIRFRNFGFEQEEAEIAEEGGMRKRLRRRRMLRPGAARATGGVAGGEGTRWVGVGGQGGSEYRRHPTGDGERRCGGRWRPQGLHAHDRVRHRDKIS